VSDLTRETGPVPLACDVPGVTAWRRVSGTGEQRLYECPSGAALAARRRCDPAEVWEVAVLGPDRYVHGGSEYVLGEDIVLRLVGRLAAWPDSP
jgi:hypothetical protein